MLGVAGLVLFGPKELPKVLGTIGRYVGKLRRMALDLRAQSGIDEVLRSEGIANDLEDLRRMARGGGLNFDLRRELTAVREELTSIKQETPFVAAHNNAPSIEPSLRADRSREYPEEGADASGAVRAAHGYDGEWPASALATDDLYLRGEAS